MLLTMKSKNVRQPNERTKFMYLELVTVDIEGTIQWYSAHVFSISRVLWFKFYLVLVMLVLYILRASRPTHLFYFPIHFISPPIIFLFLKHSSLSTRPPPGAET